MILHSKGADMSELWKFISDDQNRALLSWIGGGLVVVIGGIWAVIKYRSSRKENSTAPQVSASRGGIAAGRDIRDSHINLKGD